MTTPDLTKLKHTLVNPPLHFYCEMDEDGTETLRHIRVQQRTFQVPADGITIDTVPPDSVGTEQIIDEAVEMEDLSKQVKDEMVTRSDRVTRQELDEFEV